MFSNLRLHIKLEFRVPDSKLTEEEIQNTKLLHYRNVDPRLLITKPEKKFSKTLKGLKVQSWEASWRTLKILTTVRRPRAVRIHQTLRDRSSNDRCSRDYVSIASTRTRQQDGVRASNYQLDTGEKDREARRVHCANKIIPIESWSKPSIVELQPLSFVTSWCVRADSISITTRREATRSFVAAFDLLSIHCPLRLRDVSLVIVRAINRCSAIALHRIIRK